MNNEGSDIQKWADQAMFKAEVMPEAAKQAPQVHLVTMTADPLGAAAAMNAMYVGGVKRSLSDVTHEERRLLLEDMRKTALKLPMEAIKFEFLIEGVTRAFTHQLVRTRMAGFAQESMRFAVLGEDEPMPVGYPPSLAGTKGDQPYGAEDSKPEYWRNLWDQCVEMIDQTYKHLVDSGMPAEDARGLVPTNVLTRINMIIDLRALVGMSGLRLCTQAQFEWRYVFAQMAKSIREYNPYKALEDELGDDLVQHLASSDQWQYEAIADLFKPICYQTGKCQFEASADRKCSIRSRVSANAEVGRKADAWIEPYEDNRNGPVVEQGLLHEDRGMVSRVPGGQPVSIAPIKPEEWLLNPGAAR